LKIRDWREIQIQSQFQKIANFKRDYLDNNNDSEFTVKTKNAPFFMNFPNIYKLWQFWLYIIKVDFEHLRFIMGKVPQKIRPGQKQRVFWIGPGKG
jgi:hypothetical protein